jgi:hypothetical protein
VQVGSIASEYRTFQYEVLAGDSNLDVEVREGGAVFAFNYAEVILYSPHHTTIAKAPPPPFVGWGKGVHVHRLIIWQGTAVLGWLAETVWGGMCRCTGTRGCRASTRAWSR